MIRAPLGDLHYWNKWVEFGRKTTDERWQKISVPSKNPDFRPQYVFDLAKNIIFYYIVCRYSRGDNVHELAESFPGLLEAWELSNQLAAELNAALKPGQGWDYRRAFGPPRVTKDPRGHNDPRSWAFDLHNLNHYNWCFWLVGLALSLNIPDAQWQRLLALVGGEGEDILLDRVIASRQPQRQIGGKLLHRKPYARMLKAIDAPQAEQAALLREFVEHWYAELERKGHDELWWYTFGDPVKSRLAGGCYFGRWCLEAVAAVKAFNLDDSACLGHDIIPVTC
ncbi:PoNe immunity protein domain-containing protein [Methylobacillus glycogenes]|uniref:PoNe immunity protein domain-containing protein n=1 Tax=Methylobacillus glycogenes TaxID=406 RepID=UPI000685D602|nr:PoNe immunity protein domain-containing protein [Methylobacillus glycogenes]